MKLALLLVILAVTPAFSQTTAELNTEAVKAYQAKDYKRFLDLEQRALQLTPENPRLQYNVACGQSLNGNPKEAVRLLNQLVARKLDLGAENDTDFAAIHNTPEWRDFQSRVADLRKPIVHSEVAFTLPDPNLMATTLALDPANGDLYISSTRERKILRRTKAGAVTDFIHQAQDGFYAAANLLIDSKHHLLYATTSAVPFMLDYGPEDSGRAGIFAFDLKSGKLARKVLLAPDDHEHFLNNLTMDRAGNIYICDSLHSGIYKLAPGSEHLDVFISPDLLHATQGLAFSDDEKTLYIADYIDGLWALDMATKTPHKIESPNDLALAGMDGLTSVPDGFLAVQNGIAPPRVLHLKLDPKQQKLLAVEILEMNHPDYNEPIQGIADGNSYLYVANSQLNLGDPKTGAFAAEKAQPTVVLRLPLSTH
jgi:sugar lactone lactonase YvrE